MRDVMLSLPCAAPVSPFDRLGVLAIGLILAAPAVSQDVDFARQIRPLLSKHCFSCHGHDAKRRKGKLRLDRRASALAEREDGAAVVSGHSGKSLLYARITSTDAEERMPPADTGRALSRKETDLVRRWIDQGAKYAPHWAFTKPVRAALPKVRDGSWVKNPLDSFVLAGLEAEGLRPSKEADRYTLIRRLSFDLIGLPPTLSEVGAFVGDTSANAYERVVDRLLASPGYGERWARVWLDLARYADTQGYEKDRPRTVWPWRDWVIKALNDDMPYDQFTIEQLAGDLLPGATPQQVLATVFHRNTMTNTEGGTDDEEFRVVAVKDRVDTTGLIWLGLSVGCAKCHSHKYDPISLSEYYQLYGFFNQTADADRYDDAPTRALSSAYRHPEHAKLVGQLAAERKRLAAAPKDKAIPKRIATLSRRMGTVSVPVMHELSPSKQRETRVLAKGDFLDPGDKVESGVPKSLHSMRERGAEKPARPGALADG